MDNFGDTHKNWTILRVISMHFRVFSEGQGIENSGYFGGC